MASADVESLEELQAKLEIYNEQLKQVRLLVSSDPTNQELLKLEADLLEVLRITTELARFKESEKNHQESIPNSRDSSVRDDTTIVQQQCLFPVNSNCEVLTANNDLYPAYIQAISDEGTFTVCFFGYGNVEEVELSSLREIVPLKPIDKNLVTVGLECQAKYFVDGKWYNAVVQEITDHGYSVKFTGYGNKEEVPLEYLRLINKPKTVPAPTNLVDKKFEIPDNLKILATDTDAEKERKRKKVRALKSANRHKNIEAERNVKQHGWQAFQSKTGKKKVKGFVSSLKRGPSIFQSPDTVDGKVGVVGSGQGMTHFEDTRKKFKLREE